MEEDKAGAESTRQHLSQSRNKSTKLKRTWNYRNKDVVPPVCKRRKVAGEKFSKFHVEASRCYVEDENKQIKCCYVVLERQSEDTTIPNFRQRQKLETVKISEEQCNVQHWNKVNLESSHVKANGHEAGQTDGDGTCLTQLEDMSEDELTDTHTNQVELVLFGDEHLTRKCEVAVSKMRNILKHGPKNQDDVSSPPQCDPHQTRQWQASEGTRREIQNDQLYSQTLVSQFNAQRIRQYEAHSKRKSQCQSDSDTSAGIVSQMKVDTTLIRREQIVAGQQNLSDQALLSTKQTSSTKLRSKVTTDKWTFSKRQIEEQGRSQCNIDAVQIDEGMYDVLEPAEPDDEASEHNIEVGRPCESDTQWTGRLSALAAWRGRGSRKGVRRRPVSEVKVADEAELVYRFWAEDAQEVYRKEKAMSYLSDVKKAYRQSPQIYNKFVDLVRSLKVTTTPTKDIRLDVCKLFEDNPHLITGFNMFLPTDTTEEIHDETGITEGCPTKFQNKLVTHHVDQPTIKDTLGPGTDSTIHSVGETSAHFVKDTLAYPVAGSIVKNTSKIVNITWMNPKKSHSEEIRNIPRRSPEVHMRSILNIPRVSPETKSMMNASKISMGCPKNQDSIHPTQYTVIAVQQAPVEQSHSLCDADSMACAASRPMDCSVLDSEPLSTTLTSHPAIDTMPVDGTYPVKEGSKPFVFKSTNQGADLQGTKLLRNALHTYTSSSNHTEYVPVSQAKPGLLTMPITQPVCIPSSQSVGTAGDLQQEETLSEGLHENSQFPQATKEGISQPSVQLTCHPTQIDELPISEPTTQILAETETKNQLNAETVIQQSSHDDIKQGTETHLQTEILIGSKAETGTEREWGAEGESQNKNQLGIEAASQTTKESAIEKQLRSKVQSQTHQEKAASYLSAVKTAYMQSPQIYNKFVDLVRSLKVTTKPTKDIRQEISKLFESNPHLITGFNMFLPTDTTKEILDETGVTEGRLTKFQNKLVTQHVDQSTDTIGTVSNSTIHSVGETAAHLVKDTLAYPANSTMASKIVNSPWMNPKKSHSEEIRKIPSRTMDVQIRSILNIPIVYPESKSRLGNHASEISMGCPKNQGSIHPTEHTVITVPPVPVEQSHSLCDVDSVACAASTSMDSSVLDSHPLSMDVTSHSVIDTMSVDGTYPVKEGSKPFVLKFVNQGADLQETTLFRDAVYTYTSSFPQFPQTTKEGISQPLVQCSSHPTTFDELPISEPTTQILAETTNQLNAETVIQQSSDDDIKQGTEDQSQTEILIGSEAETGTEMRWGTGEEAQTEKMEATSQTTTKVSATEGASHTENHTGTEPETQTKNHLGMEAESQMENYVGMEAAAQTENMLGTETISQTENQVGTVVESQTESHQWAEAELKTESDRGAEAESQTENNLHMEAESQTDKQVGDEVKSQTESQQGIEAESQTENHQGAEAESQTENQLGIEAEAQTEKLLGSEATSQTESQLGVEVESQTENEQGTDVAFQTENQARTETERQTEGDQQILLPNAQPSVSNMESQNAVYVDEGKALSHVLETSKWVTRQMVRQMETEAKSTQVLTGERSVNKVTLLGRVGRPAEMRGTADYPVTVFPLATSISIKRDDGTYEQQTEWHRISIFRKGLRDIAAASITTGDRVYVSGSIKYGSFEQEGRTVYSTSIIADDVIRLTAKAAAQSPPGTE